MNILNDNLLEIQKKFKEYYDTTLKHKYSELEDIRKKDLFWFIFWFVLFSIGASIYIYCCAKGYISEKTYLSKGALKLCFLYICTGIFLCYAQVDDYKLETKFKVMDKIMQFWGDFQYSYSFYNTLISKAHIEKFKLFEKFDKQDKDDGFQGKYGDTTIKISEQKLVEVTRGGKGDYEKTIFKGVLISLQFSKKAKVNTSVYGKDNIWTFIRYNILELVCLVIFVLLMALWYTFFSTAVFLYFLAGICFLFWLLGFGKVISTDLNKLFHVNKQKVQLEDVVFSKEWKVYSNDQVEARYVLTPALMERMLMVKKLFHGNRLDFGFYGKHLLIAVHTYEDMFETTSLFTSALDYKKVQEVICQLYSVFSVIDVLKLQNESKKDMKKESREGPLL